MSQTSSTNSAKGSDHYLSDTQAWVDQFRKVHGRAPRVLHIGNIANNAYLNAKVLNGAGVQCDVICYDYYHIMGCPEWEDADFLGSVGDEFNPDWDAVDLRGFERPRWFAQGPLPLCVQYLLARRCGHGLRTEAWWRLLTAASRSSGSRRWQWLYTLAKKTTLLANRVIHRVKKKLFGATADSGDKGPSGASEAFAAAFPGRKDSLKESEVARYQVAVGPLARLFSEYDVVHAYGTDPMWPLLAKKRPYVAFEHGTIRSIPFEDTTIGRLTALAYHEADGVVITNCDNKKAAERLELRDYRFVPHPINEQWMQPGIGEGLRSQLVEEMSADFLVFHPSRQHWEACRHPSWEKGNDVFIRGMARFIHEIAPRSAAVFVEWGQKVKESETLLAELGIADRVKWIPPQHSCNMTRFIDASDVVADQFYLGAFGGIMPKALGIGKPCLLYLNEDMHRWCFPELPPIINARTPEEVFDGLKRAYEDRNWLQQLSELGQQWYDAYHSNALVRDRLTSLYRDVLNRTGR